MGIFIDSDLYIQNFVQTRAAHSSLRLEHNFFSDQNLTEREKHLGRGLPKTTDYLNQRD